MNFKCFLMMLCGMFCFLTINGTANAVPINLSSNPNALATANAEYSGRPASAAIDGDWDTYWNAGSHATPTQHHSLTVDLGNTYTVNEIILGTADYPAWSSSYYVDYELYVSSDASTWDQVVDFGRLVDEPGGYIDTIALGAVSMRYVRFEAVGGTHWAFLNEIEVWGENTPVPEPSSIFLLGFGAICVTGLMRKIKS